MSQPEPQPKLGGDRATHALDDALVQRVLTPYLAASQYVRRARLEHPTTPGLPRSDTPSTWLRLDAECAITEPCYIQATGHFNAVEMNIAYNQMLYLCLAETLRRGLLPQPCWSFDEFFRHQLPSVLITDYQARFRREMASARFDGWLMVESVQVRPGRQLAIVKTRCSCSDDGSDKNEAQVTIALVNWPAR